MPCESIRWIPVVYEVSKKYVLSTDLKLGKSNAALIPDHDIIEWSAPGARTMSSESLGEICHTQCNMLDQESSDTTL